MLPLRHLRRWQLAGILLLLAVLAAALMPAVWFWPDKIRALIWLESVDKWLHGVTFVMLSVWFAGQYRAKSYWRIALGLLAFGFIIELCQRTVGYRNADWADVAADAAGIVVGIAVAAAGAGGWSLRVEDWLLRRKTGANVD